MQEEARAALARRRREPLRRRRTVRIVAAPMTNRMPILAVLALLISACAAPQSEIDRLWTELEDAAESAQPLADPDAKSTAHTQERAQRARELATSGALKTGRDHFRAAVVLAESNDPKDWSLAASLGAKAAELGEPLGLRAAAEAIDKDLVSQGLPQRYGTQFAWDPQLGRWKLHPLDPTTTDAERASMGVPSYGELIQAEVVLNASRTGMR